MQLRTKLNPNSFEKTKVGWLFIFWSNCTALQSKHETRHVFYRMLAVCALFFRFQSYVITFLGITANGKCMFSFLTDK